MKKVWLLILMLFLAACGGGGGSSTTGGQAGGSGPTGKLALKIDRQVAKMVALDVPAPGWVRVVVSNPDVNGAPYKQVVDAPFGSSDVVLTLPAATGGYTAEVVTYSVVNDRKALAEYGVIGATFGMSEGANDTRTVTPTAINPGGVLLTVTPPSGGGLFSTPGDTPGSNLYTVAANITSPALQQNWGLFIDEGSEFTTAQHSTKALPNSSYTDLVAPVLTAQGTLHFQGEFFIKTSLLKAGERATDWTYNYNHPVATTVYVRSGSAIVVDTPVDTIKPVVSSFFVPTTVQGTTTISPISIIGSDNAGIYGYQITETNVKPSAGAPGTGGWLSKQTSYTVTGTTPAPGIDTPVDLYAWVEDYSQVCDLPVKRRVVINNSPAVTRLSIPQSSTSGTFAVTVAGKNNSGVAPLKYMIANGANADSVPVKPATTDSRWTTDTLPLPDGTTPPPGTFIKNYTVDFTPAFNTTYTIPIYAWVMDGNNIISKPVSASIVISDAPQISFSLYDTTISHGNLIWFKEFVATPVSGTIEGYAITKTPTAPASFSGTKPMSYDYGATSVGMNYFYVWVKDSAGRISSRTMSVQFADPTGPDLSDPALPAP